MPMKNHSLFNADEKSFALTHYGPVAVEVTTVLEGIRNQVNEGTEVVYAKGCDLVDPHWPESEIIDYPLTGDEKKGIAEAVEKVKQSDVAVVVLGGGIRTCGENKSRTSLELPGHQQELLEAVMETGKPVVLVLINGRPLSINWADKFVPAILEAWYPGSQGGRAIAEALFGDYNPGGKLTVTFPKTVGQIPFNFPAKPASQVDGGQTPGMGGNQARINGPLYPFGYGLSYTTFEYSDMRLSSSVITDHQPVTVTCKVKNTGSRAGDEVVQLYMRDVVSSVTTYEKSLRGFERVHLEPGETKEVKFELLPRDFQLLDIDKHWVVEPGMFQLMIGASSEDIRLKKGLEIRAYGRGATGETIQSDPTDFISASKNASHIIHVVDGDYSTTWTGDKGEYISFELADNTKINHMLVTWKNAESGSTYEIQISSGGGQFLPVQKGAVRPNADDDIRFNLTSGSDIRILITSGKAEIAEVKLPELRKE